MERGEKYFWGLMVVLAAALAILGLAGLMQQDFSARQNEGRRKLGAVYMTLNNPFYEVVDEEIRTAVENHGDVLLSRDPALSVRRQREEIEELLAQGVEVLFVNPVDWREIAPALEEAKAAGVPVIAIDTNVAEEGAVASTVVSDNYLAGVQCAEHLLQHSGGGSVALLKHTQARSGVDRMQGFCDTLAAHPEFQIVDEAECLGQLELAMPAMEMMLMRHPEINIVMALNDPAAMGALAALRQAGRLDKALVYGVDGVQETRDMIAQGHMAATAAQAPREMGRMAVEQAYKILAGGQPETLVKLPTFLITYENVFDSEREAYN